MNILRAEQYLKARVPQHERLSALYDDDEMLRGALCTLFPEFEYPDFSHLTIREIVQRYEKNPLPLVGA